MRSRIAEERIAAVVWVSVALHMAFGFAMQVAPVQVWWALKYHSLDFPEIDGYLTSGSAGSTKRLGARVWRSSPLGARDWYRPELAGEARATRSRFAQHRLLFGSFGREAKLNSPDFLGAVAQILRAVPEAGFLWTGRDRNPEIQSRLEAHGVAARCHYIGWVDTKLYAQVIDVFLDTFPFPCAYTLYESMAAARPAVQFASAEAEESGLHSMLAPLLAGEEGTPEEQERARAIFGTGPGSLYLCAADTRQYVEHALRLAADAGLRRAAGEANRRFIAEFLSDPAHVARTLATHLVEIIREKGDQGPR
jgi:predicted O-linked N-acetylglucosamine transferase (SPINDLY family)